MFPPISREADTALGSEQYGFLIQCFNTNHSLEGKTKNIIKKKQKTDEVRVLEIERFQISAPYGPKKKTFRHMRTTQDLLLLLLRARLTSPMNVEAAFFIISSDEAGHDREKKK